MTDPRCSTMALEACERCDGLVPAGHRVCLHCDRARPRWRGARLAARLIGASATMVTLMACYGMIRPTPQHSTAGDRDGDGATTDVDCDDARGDVYPGAADRDGDAVDQNCDGVDGWRDPAQPPPAPPAVATEPAPTPTPTPPKAIATDPPP